MVCNTWLECTSLCLSASPMLQSIWPYSVIHPVMHPLVSGTQSPHALWSPEHQPVPSCHPCTHLCSGGPIHNTFPPRWHLSISGDYYPGLMPLPINKQDCRIAISKQGDHVTTVFIYIVNIYVVTIVCMCLHIWQNKSVKENTFGIRSNPTVTVTVKCVCAKNSISIQSDWSLEARLNLQINIYI